MHESDPNRSRLFLEQHEQEMLDLLYQRISTKVRIDVAVDYDPLGNPEEWLDRQRVEMDAQTEEMPMSSCVILRAP